MRLVDQSIARLIDRLRTKKLTVPLNQEVAPMFSVTRQTHGSRRGKKSEIPRTVTFRNKFSLRRSFYNAIPRTAHSICVNVSSPQRLLDKGNNLSETSISRKKLGLGALWPRHKSNLGLSRLVLRPFDRPALSCVTFTFVRSHIDRSAHS